MCIRDRQNTAVALGVKIDRDYSVGCAGGMIIQVLPGAEEGAVVELEKTGAAMEPITSVVEKTDGVRGMAREIFSGLPSEYALEELEIRNMDWKCDCSEERLAKVLMTIGKKDLKEIIEEDNEAELVCQFCLKKYKFEKAHLERILASAEK